jgi:putative endonuclease
MAHGLRRRFNGGVTLVSQARRMAPSLSRGTPFVYILRLHSGGLYIGCSTDYEARLREHQKRTGCRTTKRDPPVSVLWIETVSDFPTAHRREAQIKKWSRAKKEALIRGDLEQLRQLSKSGE